MGHLLREGIGKSRVQPAEVTHYGIHKNQPVPPGQAVQKAGHRADLFPTGKIAGVYAVKGDPLGLPGGKDFVHICRQVPLVYVGKGCMGGEHRGR